MKSERVYLDELKANNKGYKVKVKVIEKGRAKVSPKKGVLYQSLLLENEKVSISFQLWIKCFFNISLGK